MFDSTEGLRAMLDSLRALPPTDDDAQRIDRIGLLEELKSVAAAVQAEETAAFAASQRRLQLAAGVPAKRVGRGIAAQVGLARRISPFHAQRYLGWAAVLTAELPGTLAALRAGQVSEWRAMLVARETIGCPASTGPWWTPTSPPSWRDGATSGSRPRPRSWPTGSTRRGFLARIRGAERDGMSGSVPRPTRWLG